MADSIIEHTKIIGQARNIAMKYLQPKELHEDAAYMADAVDATEVWVQTTVIATAFINPSKANTRSALLYVLCGVMSDNNFWRKAQHILSPVLANSLLKMCEGYAMDADLPNKTESVEDLIAASKLAILDVFGVIIYTLRGYTASVTYNVDAKKEMKALLFGE